MVREQARKYIDKINQYLKNNNPQFPFLVGLVNEDEQEYSLYLEHFKEKAFDLWALILCGYDSARILINEERDFRDQEFLASVVCHEVGHLLAQHYMDGIPSNFKEYINREKEANDFGIDLFTEALDLPHNKYYNNHEDTERMKQCFDNLYGSN